MTHATTPAWIRYRDVPPVTEPMSLVSPEGEPIPPALAYWANVRGLIVLREQRRNHVPGARTRARHLATHIEQNLVWAMHDANVAEIAAEQQ